MSNEEETVPAVEAVPVNEHRVKLKKGDYVIQVHIIEARDLLGRDASGMSDPVCTVSILGQKKQTKIHHQCAACQFDEVLIFEFKDLEASEVETAQVSVEVYDANTLRSNVLIGKYVFDAATVYYREHHEVYRQWAALTDTTDKHEGIQGYIKTSVVVLAADDSQYIHSAVDEDDEDGSMLAVLMPPNIEQKGTLLKLQVYKAEGLPEMDLGLLGGKCDPYLLVEYAGVTVSGIKDRKTTMDPVFNLELQVPVMEPLMSTKIHMSLYDYDNTKTNDIISTSYLDYNLIKAGGMRPTWVNLYGAPRGKQSGVANKMNRGYVAGTFYRGRVLVAGHVQADIDEPASNIVPCAAVDERDMPPMKSYVLQTDLYEGCEVPSLGIGKCSFTVQVSLGPHMVESEKAVLTDGRCRWYSVLADLHAALPVDLSQVPDVFVYLVHDKKRISYVRYPFKELLERNGGENWKIPPKWALLNEDVAMNALRDDQFPGTLLFSLRVGLAEEMPAAVLRESRPLLDGIPDFPQGSNSADAASKPRVVSKMLDLSIDLVNATNLPKMDLNGFADPFVKFNIEGFDDQVSKVVTKTLNPSWGQSFHWKAMHVNKPIIIKLRDKDTLGTAKMGQFSVDLLTLHSRTVTPQGQDLDFEHTYLVNDGKCKNASLKLRFHLKYLAPEASELAEQAQAEKEKKKGIFEKGIFEKAKGFMVKEEVLGHPREDSYQLRAHFYLGRKLPPSDQSGLADPVVVVRLGGKKMTFEKKHQTLNPIWYQSQSEVVSLPFPLSLAPDIQVFIYDWDVIGKNDPMGRFNVSCEKAEKMCDSLHDLQPEWFQLQDIATNQPVAGAAILACFQLVPENQALEAGFDLPSLLPLTTPMVLEVVTLGLRGVQSTLGAHKSYVDFELPNGKRFGTNPSKLPSAQNPNFLQVLKIPIDLPIRKIFAPSLELEVRDTLFGGLVKRLLGTASLDLTQMMAGDADAWEPVALETADRESQEREAKFIGMCQHELEVSEAEEQEKRDVARRKAMEDHQPYQVDEHLMDIPQGKHQASKVVPLLEGQASSSPHDDEDEEKEDDEDSEGAGEGAETASLLRDEVPASEEDFDQHATVALNLEDADDPDLQEQDTPTYMHGRVSAGGPLEAQLVMKPFNKIDIWTGQQASTGIGSRRKVGTFKGRVRLCKPDEVKDNSFPLSELLTPQQLFLRVYVLRGIHVSARDADNKSDPYLVLKLGKHKDSRRKNYRKNTLDPEFFESFEVPCSVPGPSQLELAVWDWDGIGDDFIGKTTIDIEDRWFSPAWRQLTKKPLEQRKLTSPQSTRSQGTLELWMELLTPQEAKNTRLTVISPPPPVAFELRFIVWGCRNVPIYDLTTGQNDLYITGHVSAPGLSKQSTDTHLRSKKGKGNFNWRMKFPLSLPMKPWPRLRVQIWDQDFFSSSDAICETIIPLKGICQKALKRNERVKVFFKGKDKFWLEKLRNVNKPQEKQGRIQVSLELLPKALADQLPAGTGRSDPNMNPFLPPPEGRFHFNFFKPFSMLKDILGSRLYAKMCLGCCCLIFLVACIFMLPMILSNLVVALIT